MFRSSSAAFLCIHLRNSVFNLKFYIPFVKLKECGDLKGGDYLMHQPFSCTSFKTN